MLPAESRVWTTWLRAVLAVPTAVCTVLPAWLVALVRRRPSQRLALWPKVTFRLLDACEIDTSGAGPVCDVFLGVTQASMVIALLAWQAVITLVAAPAGWVSGD